MKFSYQSQCFREARNALMLPFYDGEDGSLAHSFHLCRRALDGLCERRHLLEDEPDVLRWLEVVENTIDTTGLEDVNGEGAWRVKARRLSKDEQRAFSDAVRELATWFDMEFHAGAK